MFVKQVTVILNAVNSVLVPLNHVLYTIISTRRNDTLSTLKLRSNFRITVSLYTVRRTLDEAGLRARGRY